MPPGLSMVTRRKRCLPTFHSTSTTSKPSERATRSAASRMRSRSISAFPLPPEFRSAAAETSAPGAPVRAQQKSGLSPTEDCVRLTPLKYPHPLLQMQAVEDSTTGLADELVGQAIEKTKGPTKAAPSGPIHFFTANALRSRLLCRSGSRSSSLRRRSRCRRWGAGLDRISLVVQAHDVLRDIRL